jgi:hypothetical protein
VRTHLAMTLKKRGAETVGRAWGAKESGSKEVWEEHDEGLGPGRWYEDGRTVKSHEGGSEDRRAWGATRKAKTAKSGKG